MRIALKVLLFLLLPLVFLFFPSAVKADTCLNPSDDPCWVAKTPMPTARRDLGVAADASGKIYAVGGYTGSDFTNVLEVYDPATDSWATKSPVPVSRNDMGFTYNPVNGKFYLGGGYNNGLHDDFFEYDLATDTWNTKSSMLTARAGLRLAAGQNGKIYAIGGCFLNAVCVTNVEEYDPATNQWVNKSAIPNTRADFGLVVAPNGRFYAISGGGYPNGNSTILNNVDEYDPVADTWTAKAPINNGRLNLGVSVNSSGKIYAVGGSDSLVIQHYTTEVNEYDPLTDTWTTKDSFSIGLHALGMALGGDGNVYVIGGQTVNSPAVDTNYAGIPSAVVDLNVPLLKQTSDPWQSHEYDSATLWNPASPTINAWGCALTSAAMVFQYHGITKLPDSSDLDPGTLNSWLKSQSDGYVRNGLVNWLALSHLSRLAKPNNPGFPSDALEYRRINGEGKPQLTEDLQNGIPGILEEPGHFIVGKGISGTTFLINDPFYARTDLSEYSNTFRSLGRYIPSSTDLSYIMLVVNEGIDISVSSPSGDLVGESFIQQPLDNDENPGQDSGDPLRVFYLPKPVNGEYEINVSSTSASSYALDVYMYDQDGNVKKINFEGVTGPGDADNYPINFSKNITFDTLISDINFLRSTGGIKNFNTYMSLLAKAKIAKGVKEIKPAAKVILKSIQREVERQRGRALTENAYQILSTDINLLVNTL